MGLGFATEEFYQASCDAGFVKVDDIARNIAWETPTEWGDLQITINLSKPEKDPREIAAAAKQQTGEKIYVDPATGRRRPCPLCVTEQDVACGYAKKIELGGETWGMWYSPYAYYNEHCIAMSWEHRPMHVDRATFGNLLDFVDGVEGYFIGSNADLPLVGGSILGHDHFQGGRHAFPMDAAPVVERFEMGAYPEVEAGILKWPLSVIRLKSAARGQMVDAACRILDVWAGYDDAQAGIVSGFGGRPAEGRKIHNTVTPIVRREAGGYVMDLALRCNIVSDEHPLGVFHPHERYHHIKKENIGLIEVMGLAILPPRVRGVMKRQGLSRDDVGRVFANVLECAGVFKWDEAGRAACGRFLERL